MVVVIAVGWSSAPAEEIMTATMTMMMVILVVVLT